MTNAEAQNHFNPEHDGVNSVACGNEVRKARKHKQDKENREAFSPGLGFLSGNWTALTQAGWDASGSEADVSQCSGSTAAFVLSGSVRLEMQLWVV